MKCYYFLFEGGGESSFYAESEADAWEQCRKMFPASRVIKVIHA